jgi:transposase-like protein
MNMAVRRSGGTSAVTNPTATLAELGALSDLANESACLDYLRDLLFPPGTACPKCRRPSRFHRVRGRSAYACQYCGYHVYPTAGTIFRHSTTSLRSWFRAVHIVGSRHEAVTARDLQDELGITRKTALRMLERIVPLVQAGPELVFTDPAEEQALTPGGVATAPGRPTVGRAESPAAATPGLPASELVRAELLASLAGLREDLRAAELRAGDARKEVNALRDAVAAIERFSAGDTKSALR